MLVFMQKQRERRTRPSAVRRYTRSLADQLRRGRRFDSFLPYLFIFLLVASTVQAGEAWKMARWKYFQGKQENGACLLYARALHKELVKRGYKAYILGYRWEENCQTGRHAVVLFIDTDQRVYIVDNQTERPVWVRGKDYYELLNQFTKGQATITEVEVL